MHHIHSFTFDLIDQVILAFRDQKMQNENIMIFEDFKIFQEAQ